MPTTTATNSPSATTNSAQTQGQSTRSRSPVPRIHLTVPATPPWRSLPVLLPPMTAETPEVAGRFGTVIGPDDAWLSPEELAETEYWERLYGRWEPFDPVATQEFFAGFDRPWWIVGGWSIDAFTGAARPHEDVDVSFLACD